MAFAHFSQFNFHNGSFKNEPNPKYTVFHANSKNENLLKRWAVAKTKQWAVLHKLQPTHLTSYFLEKRKDRVTDHGPPPRRFNAAASCLARATSTIRPAAAYPTNGRSTRAVILPHLRGGSTWGDQAGPSQGGVFPKLGLTHHITR